MRADFRPQSLPVRRIFCETLTPRDLAGAGARVHGPLGRHRVMLLAAVRPWEVGDVRSLVDAAADAGVPLGLWPMLADHDGRWASTENANAFVDFARCVLDAAGDGPVAELTVDLEPPFARVRRWVDLRPRWGDLARPATEVARALVRRRGGGAPLGEGIAPYRHLLDDLASRGIEASATVTPFVLLEPRGLPLAQAALGSPLDGLPWSRISVMLYTTLFEGFSPRGRRGPMVDRARALRLLQLGAGAARARFGARAGVCLGAVGVGALGDEAVYREPRELAEDVRIARAAGIDDLSLLDLGGVIARAPLEPWLEAFTGGGGGDAAPAPLEG